MVFRRSCAPVGAGGAPRATRRAARVVSVTVPAARFFMARVSQKVWCRVGGNRNARPGRVNAPPETVAVWATGDCSRPAGPGKVVGETSRRGGHGAPAVPDRAALLGPGDGVGARSRRRRRAAVVPRRRPAATPGEVRALPRGEGPESGPGFD